MKHRSLFEPSLRCPGLADAEHFRSVICAVEDLLLKKDFRCQSGPVFFLEKIGVTATLTVTLAGGDGPTDFRCFVIAINTGCSTLLRTLHSGRAT
jgi:hypothetical protein